MEYQRQTIKQRSAKTRVKDWQELHLPANERFLQEQGARCMECGVPYCHMGELYQGMALGCPINNLIPEWNDLVYQGQWREALKRLHLTNNFPEFTGRVCPAPCEGSCTVGLIGEPVTIKSIEAAIVDRGFAEGWIRPQLPKQRSGRSVAVVGSGPAGLACADELNKVGHQVTVYEREDRIGGLLMYGIPNMKLDKRYVQRRVDLLAAEGIQFVTNVEIGHDTATEELLGQHDAVVLCCGSTVPRDLPIPGREAKGIHFAMEYLRGNTRHLLDGELAEPPISAEKKDVVIIGGGDTGTDCVATAIRHGCRSVVQLEILPQPPQARTAANPWPQWPKVARSDYGQEEAAHLFGRDPRDYEMMSTEFMVDESGSVTGVKAVQVQWEQNKDGRYSPKPIPGTETAYDAQLVLLAMGFTGPEPQTAKSLDITWSMNGYGTSQTQVFVAGDMRRGQSLVVWAIDEGRRAAKACDAFLTGL